MVFIDDMKKIASPLFALCLFGLCGAWAQEPVVSNRQPLPALPQTVIPEPVAVPETIGATFVAGVGFLLLMVRRRYS